jgi:hypothetical protein
MEPGELFKRCLEHAAFGLQFIGNFPYAACPPPREF